MELVVPGSPENVWKAMATGPGTTGWFTRTTIDEYVGGVIHFDLGADGSSKGEVTEWNPPQRFAYVEREWMEGAPPVTTEVTITPRPDGQCVVRMVHSLTAAVETWDHMLEGFEGGWPIFFEVLKRYLHYFPGQPADLLRVDAAGGPDDLENWRRITSALNLVDANTGERRSTSADAPRLAGVVEYVQQDQKARELILKIDQPMDGIAIIGSFKRGDEARGVVLIYLYGAGAQACLKQSQQEWTDWFTRLLSTAPSGS